ncbi:MAG: hypothetical protein JSS69_14685 [Acidobacteria bacterium]|nr:hypothetical protein [Acidobacteriota bacterium]MBS1867158.1 hypothetical protein [Acidobacteriota bacterium]
MKRAFLFASALALCALCPLSLRATQKNAKDLKPLGKTVWNFEGGAFFATDGKLPNGPCFRMTGQVTALGFFDNLKRVDDDRGSTYMRGNETVTEFPPHLDVSIFIHDFPCSFNLKDKSFGRWLTKEDVGKLKLQLFWKRGVELRRAAWAGTPRILIRALEPNIKPDANDVPERYEWNIQFVLPSEGIPIEDSLVLTLEAPDGTLAARTSARL